jgi:uncharacterized protein YcbX
VVDKEQVGVVGELYRYPVKSMLGERLAELEVGPKGVVGDRAWALRETNGRIASAKKWANLFEFAAVYESPPEAERLAPLRITMPDGRAIRADAADASAVISAVLGRSVRLERARSDEHARGEIDPNTVFGEVGVERVMPQFTAATMPDSFALPRGSFFDSAAIHIVASGTIAYLRSLIGDDVQVDARRFRPNIVIDSGTQQNAFVEDGWLDGVLRVGDQVRIVSMESALRCVMTTHPQTDLRRDPRILRAAAQYHHARLGVFASVGAAGTVRVGDPVWLTN